MDDRALKVGIAAFMHDTGKIADESLLSVSAEFFRNHADLYQPFYHGRHTHRHAVLTAAFIEKMEPYLPSRLTTVNWELEDSFINLSAGHHRPETALQWIVAVADRVSSGWDRAIFDKEHDQVIAARDYKKTRMLPLFEFLLQEQDGENGAHKAHQYCYPLRVVSARDIFPVLKATDEKLDGKHAEEDYHDLFAAFLQALQDLYHKEDNLALWFDHFENLFMVFTSSVPAARAGQIIPDVSLYDHSKTTAALAVALYLYHRQTDTLSIPSVKDYDTKKLLVVSGDFYGIQKFIFSDSGEAGKNRSKILRGRSFAVSLMAELAADMLCREIGIPSVCGSAECGRKIHPPRTEH